MLPSLGFIPHPACVASLCPRSFVIQVMLLPVFHFTYSYPLPLKRGEADPAKVLAVSPQHTSLRLEKLISAIP